MPKRIGLSALTSVTKRPHSRSKRPTPIYRFPVDTELQAAKRNRDDGKQRCDNMWGESLTHVSSDHSCLESHVRVRGFRTTRETRMLRTDVEPDACSAAGGAPPARCDPIGWLASIGIGPRADHGWSLLIAVEVSGQCQILNPMPLFFVCCCLKAAFTMSIKDGRLHSLSGQRHDYTTGV